MMLPMSATAHGDPEPIRVFGVAHGGWPPRYPSEQAKHTDPAFGGVFLAAHRVRLLPEIVCAYYGSDQAANLFHALGVTPNDVVLYVLPTLPQLYVVILGALACGVACGVNWMLKPEQLVELVRSTKAKVIVTLGPTPGYDIWQNVQA